ncbi:hypothetical protein OESDEN_10823 [Oesophagostomum dentatum]|uniref:Uncharacterized protein n=1 Tax=Oesophagostomum dentatum TaxID=61180 RepID=A0A0B1T1R2_OESDE|nr:hypothetical protein OESDEN_10823 [Oesophagostomum dentatum]
MPGYPNEEKGNYVFATSPKTDPSEFFWQNEGRTVAKRYVCQKLTCDTDNYCSIEDVVKFSSSFENDTV